MIGIQANLLRPQKLRRILEKAPLGLLLYLSCSAMYLDDSDSTNCYSSLHFHELLLGQGEAYPRIRSKEASPPPPFVVIPLKTSSLKIFVALMSLVRFL